MRLVLLVACLAACMFAAHAQTPSGYGGKCSIKPYGQTCLPDMTCADWVNGGTCCVGAFQTKVGDFCNVNQGVCCMDSLTCVNGKCAKAGPPPCTVFENLGSSCDLSRGRCCGGNRVSCTNGRCMSPYPTTTPTPARPPACREQRGIGRGCDLSRGLCCGGLLPTLMGVKCVNGRCAVPPPACRSFGSIGSQCDPARGFCCGGNRVACTNGRCISSMGPTSAAVVVVLPVNPPAAKAPACNNFASIGAACDLSRGICCGGNRVSCTAGRCIASMGGRKME